MAQEKEKVKKEASKSVTGDVPWQRYVVGLIRQAMLHRCLPLGSSVVVTQAVQIASNSYGKSRKSQTHVDDRMPASLESCTTAMETNRSLSYHQDVVKGT